MVSVAKLANTMDKGLASTRSTEQKEESKEATKVVVKTGPTPAEIEAEKKLKAKIEADRKEAEKKAALAKIKLQGADSEKRKAINSALKRLSRLVLFEKTCLKVVFACSDPYTHIIGKEPEQSSQNKKTYFKLKPPAYNVSNCRNLCANSM